jgi:hypothetical protein
VSKSTKLRGPEWPNGNALHRTGTPVLLLVYLASLETLVDSKEWNAVSLLSCQRKVISGNELNFDSMFVRLFLSIKAFYKKIWRKYYTNLNAIFSSDVKNNQVSHYLLCYSCYWTHIPKKLCSNSQHCDRKQWPNSNVSSPQFYYHKLLNHNKGLYIRLKKPDLLTY